MSFSSTRSSTRTRVASVAVLASLTLGACATDPLPTTADDGAFIDPVVTVAADEASAGTSESSTSVVFDSSTVHDISITFDEDVYDAMIDAYVENSEKEWIEATVTIDGTTYEQAGLRLKGNSSLQGLGGRGGGPAGEVSAEDPAGLPWLIKLDKYVDDQSHDGVSDFVVRSNSSETALNEALALELLDAAGLASQDAMAVRLIVNGGDAALRLVIEHPDDVWMAENLSDEGALYKAESSGDYSYRGDDPESYDEVFDQEAGEDNADLTPLIEFLAFINDSDDATFASELGDRLDVDGFATYLAMQEIVQNFDDIDGPGNNSYLYYDTDSGQFTVVPWDYNLAFGGGLGAGVGGFGGGFPPGGDGEGFTPPDGFDPADLPDGFDPADLPDGFDPADLPDGFDPADLPDGGGFGAGGPGGFGGSNVLVERFLADPDFNALYEAALVDLQEALVDSGLAEGILDQWTEVLIRDASDLVDPATVTAEAEALADSL